MGGNRAVTHMRVSIGFPKRARPPRRLQGYPIDGPDSSAQGAPEASPHKPQQRMILLLLHCSLPCCLFSYTPSLPSPLLDHNKQLTPTRRHTHTYRHIHSCPQPNCTWSFSTEKDMLRHSRRHDSLPLQYTCPVASCETHGRRARRTFSRRDLLMRHVRDFHEGAEIQSVEAHD